MKTLVIHLRDQSTDFLKPIYSDTDWTVISNPYIIDQNIINAIESHDRIIMMGHGTPDGLIGGHNNTGYVINKSHVELLREKHCVYIWCNADIFVKRNLLHGFYTGMIISEPDEADFFRIQSDWNIINQSNDLFTQSIKSSINLLDKSMLENVVSMYDSFDNPVINFNKYNLYYRQK